MTTHEVEEMLDITKKTLIYYENEGLVKTSRDNNNYPIKRDGRHYRRNQTDY